MATRLLRFAVAFTVSFLAQGAQGQVFFGTNAPGAAMVFSVNLGPAATNVSFKVPGSGSAYSYVLVKAGSPPSDVSYDYISHLQGKTNAINLEQPEATATNYFVRVRTPSASLTHAFTLIVETNRPGFRTAAWPVAKKFGSVISGAMTNLQKEYFHVEVPSNTTWRAASAATNIVPNLYVQQGQLPTESAFLKASVNRTNDMVAFLASETAGGTYYVGAFAALSGNFKSRYSLRIEAFNLGVLDWDPGLTHAGTVAYTNVSGLAADYYFKITTANPDLRGWRTALNVWSGDANLYLKKGTLPGPEDYSFKSDRPGSDGFVLEYGTDFLPSEEWYILVRAGSGAQWSLVSGAPYAQDLGVVTADGDSSSGEVVIGGEGARFFRTVPPKDMLAWRLWLVGTNLATNRISFKTNGIPTAGEKLARSGRALLVPPNLVNNVQYIVRVDGTPGSTINLDSRHQPITPLPFDTRITNEVSGFGYATYQFTVPASEIAWQLTLPPLEGNPNMAVRKDSVPNEDYSQAFSEQPAGTADNITLVPDTLKDGTFYLTVYSANDYRFRYALQSSPPAITEIDFTSVTTNTETDRVGWRFFRLTDLDQQINKLGWNLYLTNEAPGTRIALRSSKAPGTWLYRDPAAKSANFYDALSTGNFLQRPAQQAAAWYVGVFNNSNALGAFKLVTGELTPAPIPNGQLVVQTNVPPARWDYYSIVVPSGILGWDVRLTNVLSGLPKLYVRRAVLPDITAPKLDMNDTSWPIGEQVAVDTDWTKRTLSADGTNETGRIMVAGMGRPLEPGTYYIGVRSDLLSTNASYGLICRWIGPSEAVPVVDLPWTGVTITNTLTPREAAYYRVVLPSGLRSWKMRMQPLEGEAMMVVATNWIPHVNSEKRIQKGGNEHYTRLPFNGTTTLEPGTNYIVIVGEGTNPPAANKIGLGASTFALELKGEMPETTLGTLATSDLIYDGNVEGGEVAAYHFNVDPTLLGFRVRMENTDGTPYSFWHPGPELAKLAIPYGNEGGATSGTNFTLGSLFVSDPTPEEVIMVQGSTNDVSTSYRLRITPIIPERLAFDGGSVAKIQSGDLADHYFVDIPTGAEGWDLRLVNVTNGWPGMSVCREHLAIWAITKGFNPLTATEWPDAATWAADLDWTERPLSASGEDERGRVLAMGMNRPLVPGRYYIDVWRDTGEPAAYTLQSRGIGTGYSIPVTNLAFADGTTSVSGLPPREAAYFRVEIPTNTTSWKVQLTSTGETALIVERGAVPNVMAALAQSAVTPGAGRKMQKIGDEVFVLLPPANTNYLTPGTYYLAVVSEGNGVTNNQVGAGPVDFTLSSLGAVPIVDLGQLSATNLSLLNTQQLAAEDTVFYQFSVLPEISSLDAKLENASGRPVMVLAGPSRLPYPGVGVSGITEDKYGNEGGITAGVSVSTNTITLLSVTNSTYLVTVKARPVGSTFTNASFTLRITGRLSGTLPLAFDAGSLTETNLTPGSWRFYQVEVPTNTLGWDVRVLDGGSNTLAMVIRRDSQPTQVRTTPWSTPGTAAAWPSNAQWAAGADWTRRTFSPFGTNENGHILAMGMGMPLEPGTYFVGVTNTTRTNTLAYTILSRGIGDGLAIPVEDLPFAGSLAKSNLAPREAAYYRLQVPTNAPNWKLRLTTLNGECMMTILRSRVPNVDTIRIDGVANTGKGMQRPGNEHFILLPSPGQTNLQSGTYYIAVISEGLNPASSTTIGTDSSSYLIESLGPVVPTPLGVLTSQELAAADTVEGGEVKAYRVVVPPGMLAFKARLDNRVANPSLVLRAGTAIPDAGASVGGLARDTYGNEGGETDAILGHSSVVTVANPAPGYYTLVTKARTIGGTPLLYPDASYTLRFQEVLAPEINFSSELNTNGLSNVATGLLENNERAFFRVQIPADLHGQPIIGWKLDLSQTSGLATMRVGRELLPDDVNANAFPPFAESSAIIVPPFLTNGTWYVEVRGSNNVTAFTLTSSALQLERPAWAMPAPGDTTVAPGLLWPTFGDSGLDTNGTLVSTDGGLAIGQSAMHYYAVDIPDNNSGVLRCQLDAISGNPDLYVRAASPPTLTHNPNGVSGSSYERLLSGVGTGIANWVPLDGRLESALKPGRWYLAVRAAGGINARYRLRLSVGNVTDMALHGPPLTNQFTLSNDWSYYRIQVPEEVPFSFNLGFSLTYGSVAVYLRDTIPPGNGTSVADYRHWGSPDNKNAGPYSAFTSPGTYTLGAPPLRPGSIYYIGVRGASQATFNLTVTTNGEAGTLPKAIDFYTGVEITTLPPNSQALYRIPVPPEATRWLHTSLHSTNVQFFLEQGTLPAKASSDDWRSSGANASLNKALVTWNATQKQYQSAPWPWVPGQTYYLIVSNKSEFPEDFEFRMNGRNPATDDSESSNAGDGLPDAWELYYFGNLTAANASMDSDNDGVINWNEFQEGTDPTDRASFQARLSAAAFHGSIAVQPDLSSYPLGTEVFLSPVPEAGYAFVRWLGDAQGRALPLKVVMDAHKTVQAEFKLSGDEFVTALPISGTSARIEASNVSYTKEAGEPYHAGNPGGKSIWWVWTPPVSGPVTFSTAGSAFTTLLAAYTGTSVAELTCVASDINSLGGANRSRITFNASSNTVYYVAVDGLDAASSWITLSMSMNVPGAEPLTFEGIETVGATALLQVQGPPNATIVLDASTNLIHWTPILTNATSADGRAGFVDSAAGGPAKFYRSRVISP